MKELLAVWLVLDVLILVVVVGVEVCRFVVAFGGFVQLGLIDLGNRCIYIRNQK